VAAAIVDCVDAGARVVNLSVATGQPTTRLEESLRSALDHAVAQGAIVVAAAGNQGTIGTSDITRHRAVIPVVSYDRRGRPMIESNLGGSIGRSGLGAPGEAIVSLAVEGAPLVRGGTSFATAFVTGTVALLWSLFPSANASEIRGALTEGPRRTAIVPPLLSATAAYQALARRFSSAQERSLPTVLSRAVQSSGVRTLRPKSMGEDRPSVAEPGSPEDSDSVRILDTDSRSPRDATAELRSAEVVSPPMTMTNSTLRELPAFVYALGRIDARYPTLAIEKEFAQVVGSFDSAGLTDREVVHAVIHDRNNRYLARSLCWVFTVEGLETYILVPGDPADLELLIESYRTEPRYDDLDVVIGVRHGIAPPEMCNGLAVPVVRFDQIYSFDRTSLIESIPVPENMSDDDGGRFRTLAGGLFDDLNQLADNAGATDEHRALNYLTVRYPRIYTEATEQLEKNLSFSGVQVLASQLSGARTIVDVVFSFTHRQTDVIEKRSVRVDVTEEFPFLQAGIGPYFNR